jgi:hypothetical protein
VARAGIFLDGVFSFVPGADVALSKISAAGFLLAVFLLRIRALLNPHPTESKARAQTLGEGIQCHPGRLLEARMGNRGKRKFIQVLRRWSFFSESAVATASLDAIRQRDDSTRKRILS